MTPASSLTSTTSLAIIPYRTSQNLQALSKQITTTHSAAKIALSELTEKNKALTTEIDVLKREILFLTECTEALTQNFATSLEAKDAEIKKLREGLEHTDAKYKLLQSKRDAIIDSMGNLFKLFGLPHPQTFEEMTSNVESVAARRWDELYEYILR